MNPAKAEAQTLIQRLPNDCTFEDIHYHLYVLEKVQRGLEAADTQGTLTQQETEERLKKWATACSCAKRHRAQREHWDRRRPACSRA